MYEVYVCKPEVWVVSSSGVINVFEKPQEIQTIFQDGVLASPFFLLLLGKPYIVQQLSMIYLFA